MTTLLSVGIFWSKINEYQYQINIDKIFFFEKRIHPALVLRPSWVPDSLGVNKRGVNQKMLSPIRNNALQEMQKKKKEKERKGLKTENKRAQIKEWCKLARSVKVRKRGERVLCV